MTVNNKKKSVVSCFHQLCKNRLLIHLTCSVYLPYCRGPYCGDKSWLQTRPVRPFTRLLNADILQQRGEPGKCLCVLLPPNQMSRSLFAAPPSGARLLTASAGTGFGSDVKLQWCEKFLGQEVSFERRRPRCRGSVLHCCPHGGAVFNRSNKDRNLRM